MFGKTNKTAKNYDSINATLLQKAGFIDQVMAGVYTYLPLGLRVLEKIEDIVMTGIMTNMCCESTTRDAYYRDYRVFFQCPDDSDSLRPG